MKRIACSSLLAGIATFTAGQGVPRMPVVPASQSGTSQQLPDPTGIYSGSVTFSLGTQGTFTQTWRIPIKAQRCSDCGAGQYAVGGTDYQLLVYDGGATERGSVSGIVNADGTAFLELRAANCTFLSVGLGGVSAYQSGHLGPAPGTKVKFSGGVLSGRLSGYDCFGQLLTADISLHKQAGPVSQCPYRGGYYSGTFSNSLGESFSGAVLLEQAGCAFSGFSPEGHATVDGIQTGSSTASFDVFFTPPCTGSASGTAQIFSNGVITGVSSGTIGGCYPTTRSITSSFTLTPN